MHTSLIVACIAAVSTMIAAWMGVNIKERLKGIQQKIDSKPSEKIVEMENERLVKGQVRLSDEHKNLSQEHKNISQGLSKDITNAKEVIQSNLSNVHMNVSMMDDKLVRHIQKMEGSHTDDNAVGKALQTLSSLVAKQVDQQKEIERLQMQWITTKEANTVLQRDLKNYQQQIDSLKNQLYIAHEKNS